jgi:hypothetical protein
MRTSFQGCLCGILFEGRTLQSLLKTGVVMSVRSRKSITNMAAAEEGVRSERYSSTEVC